MGLFALTIGLALFAGLCAFVIEYEESSRRFMRGRARRRALVTGAIAASFFAALGLLLVVVLLHR